MECAIKRPDGRIQLIPDISIMQWEISVEGNRHTRQISAPAAYTDIKTCRENQVGTRYVGTGQYVGATRLLAPSLRLRHLRRNRQRSFLIQSSRQLREDREVRVKCHTLDPVDFQRRQAPFALQASESSLDGRTASIQALPAQSLTRDQGMEPISVDPLGFVSHSPVGQRHFVAQRLWSAPANPHSQCSHFGGLCPPRLTRAGR